MCNILSNSQRYTVNDAANINTYMCMFIYIEWLIIVKAETNDLMFMQSAVQCKLHR